MDMYGHPFFLFFSLIMFYVDVQKKMRGEHPEDPDREARLLREREERDREKEKERRENELQQAQRREYRNDDHHDTSHHDTSSSHKSRSRDQHSSRRSRSRERFIINNISQSSSSSLSSAS